MFVIRQFKGLFCSCVFKPGPTQSLLSPLHPHFQAINLFLSISFTSPSRSSLFLQPKPENAVTIAVSSRVLFRTEREQKVFEQQGVEEYLRYQIEHENEPFAPGPAFSFVKVQVTTFCRQTESLRICISSNPRCCVDALLIRLLLCLDRLWRPSTLAYGSCIHSVKSCSTLFW